MSIGTSKRLFDNVPRSSGAAIALPAKAVTKPRARVTLENMTKGGVASSKATKY